MRIYVFDKELMLIYMIIFCPLSYIQHYLYSYIISMCPQSYYENINKIPSHLSYSQHCVCITTLYVN